jgi:bacteriocin biosynthesis cyclodehydratase domain-containing protein
MEPTAQPGNGAAGGTWRQGTAGPVTRLRHSAGRASNKDTSQRRRAPSIRVGIVGLEASGMAVARLLAAAGINDFLLADPIAVSARETRLLGIASDQAGRLRQDVVADELTSSADVVASALGAEPLVAQTVANLVRSVDVVIATTDRRSAVVHDWVDHAALNHVPALHGAIRAGTAVLGPTVLPSGGPCHRCWRLRALACGTGLESAQSVEQLNDSGSSADHENDQSLPSLASYVASMLGQELLNLMVDQNLARFVKKMQTYSGLDMIGHWHSLLRRPDCPTCGPWKRRRSADAIRSSLPSSADHLDFDRIEGILVSSVCGVIKSLEDVPKVAEPEQPHIMWAELANAPLSPDVGFLNSSGKGWSRREARDGAVAEAVEHYCGLMWRPEVSRTARQAQVGDSALDPRHLLAEKVASDGRDGEDTVLEWTPTRSLLTGGEVWVPIQAVSLNYRSDGGRTCIWQATTNGLAAGAGIRDAVTRALLEVIERDAFFRCWMGHIPALRVVAADVPDPSVKNLVHEYADSGVHLDVYLLPTDTAAHVAAAVARAESQLPARALGLGAAFNPVHAVRRAVAEAAQVRLSLMIMLQDTKTLARASWLAEDPSRVSTMEEHGLLYAMPQSSAAFAFLEDASYSAWNLGGPSDHRNDQLDTLINSVGSVASDLLYVDVTTPDIVDTEIAVARVMVPGFIPPWLGAGAARLMDPRVLQGSMARARTSGPAAATHLNGDPHPLL